MQAYSKVQMIFIHHLLVPVNQNKIVNTWRQWISNVHQSVQRYPFRKGADTISRMVVQFVRQTSIFGERKKKPNQMVWLLMVDPHIFLNYLIKLCQVKRMIWRNMVGINDQQYLKISQAISCYLHIIRVVKIRFHCPFQH